MLLEVGIGIIAKDVHGTRVSGGVSKILVHTVIVSKGAENYLVEKRELEKQELVHDTYSTFSQKS